MTNFKKKTLKDADYVKKIDNDDVFDDIPSNIKRSRTMKKKDRERYSVWYNHFKDTLTLKEKDNLAWVIPHHETILKYIKDTYKEPDFSPVSRRHHLEGLGNVLLSTDKIKFRGFVRQLFNEGKAIQIEADKERENGELNETDIYNYVSYSTLCKARDKLYDSWMDDKKNKKYNIYHMLLSVNTYIPPLRRQWNDMQIYIKASEPPKNNQNYLWGYEHGKWAIVINHDKIENKRKDLGKEREIFKLEDEIKNVTDGNKLNELISLSLSYFPRKYLLSGIRTDGSMHMAETSYDQALGYIFEPKKPATNLLRKAYINHWHNQNLSPKILKQIAHRMRHTLGVAITMYKKTNIINDDDIEIKDFKKKTTVEKVEEPTPTKKFIPKDYMKEYRLKNPIIVKEQRKELYEKNKKKILMNKILRNLNNGVVDNPSPLSIKNYGLYYDKESKQWKGDLEMKL